ncbi:WecB/TagA/CpsF family glycosyltransferase [Rhizobiaceae bacterium BDR2-2]|uniref:WecB/TagA/CpsF family glycosyltransferase n=1 Tax=Ectorhizobium quercum TaxID=2965071 RepID=A0AAE3N1T0_9HYPH|nr:WecB/TagA/CpsF family glycosyltransferase [Ectorhizobium quercum]MCX8998129.1 WecB/TagA/CpsF family glycosyltransferase [Ectorhizobium quercum]
MQHLCEPAPEDRRSKLLFDLNGHALALSRSDSDYREALNGADVVHVDGEPLVFASKLLTSTPVRERSATTDLIYDIAADAAAEGKSFFLIGGTEGLAADAAARLKDHFPDLIIAGHHHGYFQEAEEAEIFEKINASGADIVWVGLGKPKEQLFAVRAQDKLHAGWIITCGGCFNFIVGHYTRAPRWMQSSGLEWLHRLATRPREFVWRYLTTNPVALCMLILHSASGEKRQPAPDSNGSGLNLTQKSGQSVAD